MLVYNLRNRKTGQLERRNHWSSLGILKSYITRQLAYNAAMDKFTKSEMDLVVYELIEKETLPITANNDFNKLMYLTLEGGNKKCQRKERKGPKKKILPQEKSHVSSALKLL